VVGNLADEPPFELELQIMIVGQWRVPVLSSAACSSARTMSGRYKTSTRPIRLISGDFDLDLFRLGLFALGQMDL
jgi:hypothetical protein